MRHAASQTDHSHPQLPASGIRRTERTEGGGETQESGFLQSGTTGELHFGGI
jgi:hypothetical protein